MTNEDDNALVTLQIRLTKDMVRWIDDYRRKMTLRPSRAQFIRHMAEVAKQKIEADTLS